MKPLLNFSMSLGTIFLKMPFIMTPVRLVNPFFQATTPFAKPYFRSLLGKIPFVSMHCLPLCPLRDIFWVLLLTSTSSRREPMTKHPCHPLRFWEHIYQRYLVRSLTRTCDPQSEASRYPTPKFEQEQNGTQSFPFDMVYRRELTWGGLGVISWDSAHFEKLNRPSSKCLFLDLP